MVEAKNFIKTENIVFSQAFKLRVDCACLINLGVKSSKAKFVKLC